MAKTELGVRCVNGHHYEFLMQEETSSLEVRDISSNGVYLRGRLVSGDGSDLPEEFDDAVRALLRNKPR